MDFEAPDIHMKKRGMEKRALERRGVELPCRLRLGAELREAKILDLSLGGAFVQADPNPPAGAEIELTCALHGHELKLQGVVRHSGWFLMGFRNANGFGVEFSDLSTASQEQLQAALQLNDRPADPKFSLEH